MQEFYDQRTLISDHWFPFREPVPYRARLSSRYHHAHGYRKIKVHVCAFRYSRSSSVRQRTTVQFERISTICGFIRFLTSDLKSILPSGERSVHASGSGRQNNFATFQSYVSTASISLNATRSTGFSPAQLLMGRRIQSRLPTLPSTLQPKWPNSDVISKITDSRRSPTLDFTIENTVRNRSPNSKGEKACA